jgi:hypothetical protein
VLKKGTHLRATLNTALDSTYNVEGDEFQATVMEPVIIDGEEAIPAGSKLTGQITNVVSARNFNFGKNAKIDVKFTHVQTPSGQKYPITGSIDARQLQKASGQKSAASRAARSTGKGALRGGLWGAGTGAVLSAARGGNTQKLIQGAAKGAVVGSVIGGGIGLASSGVKKGNEVRVPPGTVLPVQLDEVLVMKTEGQVLGQQQSATPPPMDQGGYPSDAVQSPPGYPSFTPPPVQSPPGYPAFTPPPVQQPYGYAPPQGYQQPPPYGGGYPPPQQYGSPPPPQYPYQR